ncbi:MAG TPA: S41 family peptidase [Bryobacteraceae bacterium]|nr:S41 family peptidase [Bryobacteraceae bacterium]
MAIRFAGLAALLILSPFSVALAAPALSPHQHQLNIDSFEFVWHTVRDRHWDPKLGGLDWQKVHDELRPAIEKASTMDQARAVMDDMLSRLHETHFAILPSDVYSSMDEDRARSWGDGTLGMDLRVLNGHAIVTSIDPDSPAEKSGVRPGWEIVRVRGKDFAPLIARLEKSYRQSSLRALVLRETLLGKLGGFPEDDVSIEFLDGANQPVKKILTFADPKGTLTRFGFFPPTYIWLDYRRVDSDIGYVHFNLFMDPGHLMPKFGQAVEDCMSCKGLIIDLRGNPGGLGAMAMGMAGWFFDRPNQRLGTLFLRDSKLQFVINPRPRTYAGPLAILVDGTSASTSEIFAEGLKDLKRARIFGTPTAAAALPSMIEKLPNGDAFQFAIANYISEGGKPLEGIGITPDVEAAPDRAAFLAGKDPALDAAVQWIQSEKRHPAS